MKTISIKGKEYALRMSWGAIYGFECTGLGEFYMKSARHRHAMAFCALAAVNKDFDIPFSEYVEALDGDPNLVAEIESGLVSALNEWSEAQELARGAVAHDGGGEKKNDNGEEAVRTTRRWWRRFTGLFS